MAIVSLPLTYQLTNGQPNDATQVMVDLNQISNNVNANATEAAVLAASGGAALVGFDGNTLANFLLNSNSRVVTSIAALRGLSKLVYTKAFVTGYYASGDGGGGDYYYDSADVTSADNGGTIIVAADGGRWKLVVTNFIRLEQFGAKGDGVTNDSAAINAALAIGGNLLASAKTYYCSSSITWQVDGTVLQGVSRNSTIFSFPSALSACFVSSTKGATTRLYCKLLDCQVLANANTTVLIDWTDMQLGEVSRCLIFGNALVGQIGLKCAATNSILQCTYNVFIDNYYGNTTYGMYLTDGANANQIISGRAQLSAANAIGILFTSTGANLVNANQVFGFGCEQPGHTMTGIQLNGNTKGITLVGCRFEQLLVGIVIQATDVNPSLLGNYYDSCTTDVLSLSSTTISAEKGLFTGENQVKARGSLNGSTNVLATGAFNILSTSHPSTGVIVVTMTTALTDANYSVAVSSSTPMHSVTIGNSAQFTITTYNSGGANTDAPLITFSVTR